MPKVRLLAPWTNEKGEPQAAGAIVDVSDEQAQDLNGRGQASLVAEEEAQAKQQAEEGGHYAERAERPESPPPPPSKKDK